MSAAHVTLNAFSALELEDHLARSDKGVKRPPSNLNLITASLQLELEFLLLKVNFYCAR